MCEDKTVERSFRGAFFLVEYKGSNIFSFRSSYIPHSDAIVAESNLIVVIQRVCGNPQLLSARRFNLKSVNRIGDEINDHVTEFSLVKKGANPNAKFQLAGSPLQYALLFEHGLLPIVNRGLRHIQFL
jgi:hypothetical protein